MCSLLSRTCCMRMHSILFLAEGKVVRSVVLACRVPVDKKAVVLNCLR